MTTLTTAEAGMSTLRQAAEAAEEATGLRAEIIRGVIVMSPSPRVKHARVINALYDQLRPVLSEEWAVFQVVSVSLPSDPDDYAIPDLLVCTADVGDSDDWLAEPGSVELVVEVVSNGNSTKDTVDMVSWYAEAGIPAYLIVDPRDGSWTLYTEPRGGEYRGRLRKEYGEDVVLERLGVTVRTSGMPVYGRASGSR